MTVDPLGIISTFTKCAQAWLAQPLELARAQQELAHIACMLSWHAMAHVAGGAPVPMVLPSEGDERFSDAAWRDNPVYRMMMQSYLATSRSVERLVYDTRGVSKADARCAAFWVRQAFNAAAPSNAIATNPEAMRRAWHSGGTSVLRGCANLLEDLAAGDLRMVDSRTFILGKNLANTPGAVVFRNALMEVIHYHPLRQQVHAVPIVIVPPWINKYYILDLNEHKSMVRFLLSEGFNVFIMSWKNPGADMADSSYEEHLFDGALAAVNVARAICRARQVHAVGYCIGGTALATLMAWLNRAYPDKAHMPIAHWSLLATLTDFSRPGEVSSFINDDSIATLDALMAKQGYLDAKQIGWSFRLLRANSQIWRYVVHKYLYGETPPALDVLAWNEDGIRQSQQTHSYCLHQLYLENKLARKNAIVLRGYPIDLARIEQALYAVGAQVDHITPWRGTFTTAALVRGPVRYVLSSSGHILGIVNPPDPRSPSRYWAADAGRFDDGKLWLAAQTSVAGSWWTDWTAWLRRRCGPMQTCTTQEHPQFPRLCDAPGTYVRQ
jgi:polyhydroxyalkanoate synthase